MKYEVVLTDEARQSVRECVAWYAEQSQSAADRWYAGFYKALDSLAADPHRCALARENARFPIELRELNYGSGRRVSHRILFAIRPNCIVVYAVRHVAQLDWRADEDRGAAREGAG